MRTSSTLVRGPALVLLASLVLLAAACSKQEETRKSAAPPGESAAPPGESPAPAADEGGLPVVGTLGVPPSGLDGPVATLAVHADGKVELEGKAVADAGALKTALGPLADAHRKTDTLTQPSLTSLLIRADRRVPWGIVQWCIQSAADPEVRIYRILYVVRGERDPAERTFAAYLPFDAGLMKTPGVKPLVLERTVGVRPADGGVLPLRALHAALARDANSKGLRIVSLDAAPEIPLGAVLSTADAVVRTGVGNVLFRGIRGPREGEGFAARTKELLSARGDRKATLTLDGKPLVPSKGALPVPPGRVTNDLEGITDPAAGPLEIVKEILHDDSEGK